MCGESFPECPSIIEFHHAGEGIKPKGDEVSRLLKNNATQKRILEEIEKCTPLCATCHRRVHYSENEKERLESRRRLALKEIAQEERRYGRGGMETADERKKRLALQKAIQSAKLAKEKRRRLIKKKKKLKKRERNKAEFWSRVTTWKDFYCTSYCSTCAYQTSSSESRQSSVCDSCLLRSGNSPSNWVKGPQRFTKDQAERWREERGLTKHMKRIGR